jgi:hypothetical protein
VENIIKINVILFLTNIGAGGLMQIVGIIVVHFLRLEGSGASTLPEVNGVVGLPS